MCVEFDTLYVELIILLIIFPLNNEAGVSPMTHQFDSYRSGMTLFLSKTTHSF